VLFDHLLNVFSTSDSGPLRRARLSISTVAMGLTLKIPGTGSTGGNRCTADTQVIVANDSTGSIAVDWPEQMTARYHA
jgi:hypothetical protein